MSWDSGCHSGFRQHLVSERAVHLSQNTNKKYPVLHLRDNTEDDTDSLLNRPALAPSGNVPSRAALTLRLNVYLVGTLR